MEGSLGASTVLPSNLRNQIASIQAPNMGATSLPSKYYHTIGAAYATCSLARGGVPGFMVRKIQSVGINTYRMVRLCQMVEHRSSHRSNDALVRPDAAEYIFTEAKKIRDNPQLCPRIADPDFTGELSSVCSLGSSVSASFFDSDITDDILRRKVSNLILEIDASVIFVNEVLPANQCQEVQLSNSSVDDLLTSTSNKNCQSFNISPQRCQNARQKLKTWWIDFKWSEAQHQAGANFASDKCLSASNYFNWGLEKSSCEALKQSTDSSFVPVEVEVVQ